MNLLLQHLFDAAAVGECLWDHYLAPSVRDRLDGCTGGRWRAFLALLCGVHDVGNLDGVVGLLVFEVVVELAEHAVEQVAQSG
ncbi:hypothetical protein M0M45_10010 [Salinispora arenicola]|nr:hypothetical protein [Salinispora arenicola]